MEVPAYRTISPNKDEHLCGAFRTQWLLLAVTTATRAHNVTEYHESESEVAQSATPWTVAYQTPLSMGFSRQEYGSALPFPSPGDLPTQGSNQGFLHCRWILYQLSHKGSPSGHEFEQTPGDGVGQASLVTCSPWSHSESDMTEWLNNNKNSICQVYLNFRF